MRRPKPSPDWEMSCEGADLAWEPRCAPQPTLRPESVSITRRARSKASFADRGSHISP
jgi:hypothetical protein